MPDSDDTTPRPETRESRIAQIIGEVARRRAQGAPVGDESIIAAHPDLMPELADRLASLRRVQSAKKHADTGAPLRINEGHMPGDGESRKVTVLRARGADESDTGARLRDVASDPMAIGGSDLPTNDADKPSLPTPPTRQPPRDFGDYQFIEKLGKGAFGVVYKAWSKSKHRFEAMKILNCPGAPAARLLQAFRAEIQRMANVPGAQVAHVYHVGELPDGRPFFTMEYLNGGPIDRYCARSRAAVADRLRIMAEVCEAVHVLHEHDLVHCDLKPGNILVAEEGGVTVPKLVDFGLASHLSFRESPDRGGVGTLPYMSPEQMESRGGDPQRRWDVYALGATLYELLVGRCPIESFPTPILTPLEELASHVRKTPIPPLTEALSTGRREQLEELASERKSTVEALRTDLKQPWLQAVVAKALAKVRDERFATAAEMAQNLRACMARRRPTIVPPTPRDRVVEFVGRNWLALGGAVVLAVIALMAVLSWYARATAREQTVQRLIAQGCAEVEPALAIRSFQEALKLDPLRSDVRLHLASSYVALRESERAIETMRAIPECDPNYARAQAFIRGFDQFRVRRGTYELPPASEIEAGDQYYSAMMLGPDQAERAISLLTLALERPGLTHAERFHIRLLRAVRFLQAGNVDALDSESAWLVETVPNSSAAWMLRGLADWRKQRLEDAQRSMNESIQRNPHDGSIYRARADLAVDRKAYVSALNDCARAVELDPGLEPFVQAVRIEALRGTGKLDAAMAECESIQNHSTQKASCRAHFACGGVWLQTGHWTLAWRAFDRAVATVDQITGDRPSGEFNVLVGRGIAAFRCKRFSDAVDDLSQAEAVDIVRWRQEPTYGRIRGLAYLLQHQPLQALPDLRFAAESLSSAFTYLWLWDVLLDQGRLNEAQKALASAKTAAAGNEWVGFIVGHCMGKVDREALLTNAGDDPTRRLEAYYYIGLTAKARRDHAEAKRAFEFCLRLNVENQYESALAEIQLHARGLLGE